MKLKLIIYILFILVVTINAQLSQSQSNVHTAPEIISVFPDSGAIDVPYFLNGDFKIVFSQSMDTTSIINAIQASPTSPLYWWKSRRQYKWIDEQTLIFGHKLCAIDALMFVFLPDEEYIFTIDTTAASKDGKHISSNYQWSFKTTGNTIDPSSVLQLIKNAYLEHHGLEIQFPVSVEDENRGIQYWTSTAWVEEKLYRLHILGDGTVLPSSFDDESQYW